MASMNTKSIQRTPSSWQSAIHSERNHQISRAEALAIKTAKSHMRKLKRFVVSERLAGRTVAASFAYHSIRLYSGADMASLDNCNTKPKLELTYPRKMRCYNPKNVCPEARKAFTDKYRAMINEFMGCDIAEVFLTEIKE